MKKTIFLLGLLLLASLTMNAQSKKKQKNKEKEQQQEVYLMAAPEEKTTGIIAGTVIDSDLGISLGDATVVLESQGSKILSVNTDIDGKFEFKDLKYGNYDISVQKSDYSSNIIMNINIDKDNDSKNNTLGLTREIMDTMVDPMH